jgi:trigger factor
MKVKAQPRPGSIVELSIEVPTDAVEQAIDRAYGRLAPRVKVPGFRPGKAPRELLEREIGWPALREEALQILVPQTVTDAVKQENLEAIDTPHVHVETFEHLQPAHLIAHVTVKPRVKLGDYRKIKAAQEPVNVGEAQVDESLGEIRGRFAELVPADERAVQDNDELVVDIEVLDQGQPVESMTGTDQVLRVDPSALLPGLRDGLVGMRKDETRAVAVALPAEYPRPELAGKEVTVKVTVKAVKERRLPPLDDELARMSGAGETLAELRATIEERLRVALQRDVTVKQQKDALDQLIAKSEFEVPEAMVEAQQERELRNLAINLEQQGIDFEKFAKFGGVDLQKMVEEGRPSAVESVRQELVLDALATAEQLAPSDAHVAADAQRSLGESPDKERLLQSDRVREYVRERIRLQWALLWLAAQARGESWSPPTPEEVARDAQAAVAAPAAEVLEGPGGEESDEQGMVEI